MAQWTVTFVSKRGWLRPAVAALGVVAVILGVSALPGLLFGTRLSAVEAEESIRGHLAAQAALDLQRRWAGAVPEERARLEAGHLAKADAVRALELTSVDVDTVLLSIFSIRRSFVVKVVARGSEGRPVDRYFCFMGKVLTSECSEWRWLLAW